MEAPPPIVIAFLPCCRRNIFDYIREERFRTEQDMKRLSQKAILITLKAALQKTLYVWMCMFDVDPNQQIDLYYVCIQENSFATK